VTRRRLGDGELKVRSHRGLRVLKELFVDNLLALKKLWKFVPSETFLRSRMSLFETAY